MTRGKSVTIGAIDKDLEYYQKISTDLDDLKIKISRESTTRGSNQKPNTTTTTNIVAGATNHHQSHCQSNQHLHLHQRNKAQKPLLHTKPLPKPKSPHAGATGNTTNES
ncbi:hypothetical protein QL285_034583 [Trifolium repens]|nr:hypothetical protein QL285_034583 [Trifolium repens]